MYLVKLLCHHGQMKQSMGCVYIYIYIYIPPRGLSSLAMELMVATHTMQSSLNELSSWYPLSVYM